MFLAIGALTVMGCVLGGYVAMGGSLMVLYQPFELVIIGGAAVGAYIIGNPKDVIAKTGSAMGAAAAGSPFTKESYLELLGVLYSVFKLSKSKGMLALEQHIENPQESSLFKEFPGFLKQHHAVDFLCDYLRLMTMGSENPHQMEDLMNEELETHHAEQEQMASAISTMGDGLPALGIVAAVLGVIKTMGAISQPPEILGKYIGGALVGTFLGVLLAYGFVGPIASALKAAYDGESKYYECIKSSLLAFMNGYPPAVAVEYGRKTLFSNVRPSFAELEIKKKMFIAAYLRAKWSGTLHCKPELKQKAIQDGS